MYQHFGAREVDNSRTARLRLFVPDNAIDSEQYSSGGLPNIATVHVFGDFQSDLGKADWQVDSAFQMKKSKFKDPEDGKEKGWLYELVTPTLPEGFYQYKFHITFNSGKTRVICDPCTRYGGATDQNSAFVIGGPKMDVVPLAHPRGLEKLVVYELMIDDFTHRILGNRAPLAVVRDKIDYLADMGVTAIQFMPWTQWPGPNFNWGYEPHSYFAAAFRYTLNPADETEKLFLLKQVISKCHERGIHVFLDGVFNHVADKEAHEGFGYHWLWENPDDSPFTGTFSNAWYGKDLDFNNGCVLQFVYDVCRYWVEEFAIDGIRLDNTLGFYAPADPHKHGLVALVDELRPWLDDRGLENFPIIIEHEWDYPSINVVNQTGVTSCWLDPFRGRSRDYLSARQIQPGMMRFLDSARDFKTGRTPLTYIENHDHESLALNGGSRDEWWRMQPYAIALMTASGAPQIHNGQEFAERYQMPEDDSAPAAPDTTDPALRRIVPRPLHWSYETDGPGSALLGLYRKLIDIRHKHPGLTSPDFHPRFWNESWTRPDGFGFGIDVERQVVVYHRWGNAADGRLEKFYIVLNFSQSPQRVDVSFPDNGAWNDLLSGWQPVVQNNWLSFEVGSNWGHVFYRKY